LGANRAPLAPPVVTVPDAAPEVARVYIKNRFVFVRPRPDANADWFGFLWFGASVALRRAEPVRGRGCATFYAIEPSGYICVDGKQATLDPNDPVFKTVAAFAPKLDRAEPHHYAESTGAEKHASIAGLDDFGALPALFHEPRLRLLPLSTFAYIDEHELGAQHFLLGSDLTWVDREQVKPYPSVTFHGVELGQEWHLPVAFFRKAGAHVYQQDAAGRFARSAELFPLHSVVQLTAEPRFQHGERYFALENGKGWVREIDAVVPVARSRTPWGARLGSDDRTGLAPKNARHTWLEVSVLGGWLLAFEGTRAVYATLISPGRGGVPQEGKSTLEIAATPLGTFPISGKLATITLESPGEYVHSDVPWTQNFLHPYAIHTAYWHDNWGNPQSGGCINVAPIDGKWLFEFSEPALPPGWHALRWQPEFGAPTVLVVHE